jgi:ABC-type iron transport system FetAB permease component
MTTEQTKIKLLTIGFCLSVIFNLSLMFVLVLYSNLAIEIKNYYLKQQELPTNINTNSQVIKND